MELTRLSKKDQATLRRMLTTLTPKEFKQYFSVTSRTARKAANDGEIGSKTKTFLRESLAECRTAVGQ